MKKMAVNPTSSIASVLILTAVFSVSAQESIGSLLDSKQVSQIAAAMYEGYLTGNVNQMLKDENDCWEDAARRKPVNRAIAAGCATAAFAGGIIDVSYARQQRRGSHPQYTAESIRARILRRTGLSEAETQRILDETVVPNMEAILSGLSEAGMR